MSDSILEAEFIAGQAVNHADPFRAEDDVAVVALPTGYRLESFEQFQHKPQMIRRNVNLESLDQLVAYGKEHAADHSRYYVSEKKQQIQLIVDEPSQGQPRWERHSATLKLEKSEPWRDWTANDRSHLGQVEFAEFIEDHLEDVVDPASADLLQVVKDFQLKRDVEFRKVVHLESGDVQFQYDEKSTNSGRIAFPGKFTLGIPVYKNEQAFQFDCRLKYRMHDGSLSLRYEIVRIERVIETAFKKLEEQLAAHEVESFRGWVK